MKNILFDLDGTLTDSKIGITTSVAYALEKDGRGKFDPSSLLCFIGPPLKQMFMKFCNVDDEDAVRLVKYYRERFSTIGLFENKPYDGIEELLSSLKEKKLFVATSKPTIFAKRILEKFNIIDYFVGVYGSELDGIRTDKAEVISYVIEKENLHPEDCIMVGDKEHDIIGAKKNNIISIGVMYGYGSRQELQNAGANNLAENIAELKEKLLKS